MSPWEATYIGQYLNCESKHHIENNWSSFRIVIYRREHPGTEEVDKITKVDHIKKLLEARGYKRWICYKSVSCTLPERLATIF